MNRSASSRTANRFQHPAMDFNGIKEISQEEERESLIMNNNSSSYNGTGVAAVKVVEYMLSSMSNELLCKFPDNSAFDFDYTQSSIWSPLVPHPSNTSSPALDLQRKLSYDEEDSTETVVKKFTANVKDTILDSCMFSCFRIHHKFSKKKMMAMKRRRSSFRGFDKLGPISSNAIADPGCASPIQIKMNSKQGWKKVLKAASKQFKKTMKKKDSGSHLKLSSNGFSQISY